MGKVRLISLFTGYGGLDMGVRTALDRDVETVAVSDVEPGPLAVEHYRYADAIQLGDITRADWSLIGECDILVGGFPCTDASTAGQRAGLKRGTCTGLWLDMATGIRRLRPRLVVMENVTGLLSASTDDEHVNAFGRVLVDLHACGYDALWMVARASDVGAPHRRARVFLVAYDRDRTSRMHVAHDPWVEWADGMWMWTGRDTLFGDRDPFVGAWPEQGIMIDGCAYTMPRMFDTTPADDMSVMLPTPKASDPVAEKSTRPSRGPDGSTALGAQIDRLTDPRHHVAASPWLPTPRANDVKGWNQRRNQENLHGAVMLGTMGDGTRTDWGRFTGAIRRWERILDRPAPSPVQATGVLRRRILNENEDGTLLDPRWLALHAPRPTGIHVDQGERERVVRRWRTVASGRELIDPEYWNPGTLADPDTPIPGDRMPAECVLDLWEEHWRHTAGHARKPPSRRQLSPRFVEWMMGLPDGWVTDPRIWRNVSGNHRNMQLRMLGNGVVPRQAEHAIRRLLDIHQRLVNGDA